MVLYIINGFCFFRRRDSLSKSRVERRCLKLASKGNLVITLAAWLYKLLELITQVTTQT